MGTLTLITTIAHIVSSYLIIKILRIMGPLRMILSLFECFLQVIILKALIELFSGSAIICTLVWSQRESCRFLIILKVILSLLSNYNSWSSMLTINYFLFWGASQANINVMLFILSSHEFLTLCLFLLDILCTSLQIQIFQVYKLLFKIFDLVVIWRLQQVLNLNHVFSTVLTILSLFFY